MLASMAPTKASTSWMSYGVVSGLGRAGGANITKRSRMGARAHTRRAGSNQNNHRRGQPLRIDIDVM